MNRLVPLFALALVVLGTACARSAAPDYTASATYGEIRLTTGFTPDPVSRSLTAGGSIQPNVGGCNYGYVARRPDFKLYYEAGSTFPLHIFATADQDITLLVNTPDGRWHCNDDGHTGLNPLLTFSQPQSGRYDIWVGTYRESRTPATLHISELTP